MSYKRIFDPEASKDHFDIAVAAGGDRQSKYIYTQELILLVNVALATERPLLVQGPPGCGKSSLALDVARRLNRRYYAQVVTSRTQAQDLLWHFDAVRRLGDAHANQKTEPREQYIEPRAIWWAFDPELAARRGFPQVNDGRFPKAKDPLMNPGTEGAVVLIDEIDKAEADVPNDLLVTLGALKFRVEELGGIEVAAKTAPFVVITSNDERELPAAFVRRCVTARLAVPDAQQLEYIARAHFPLQSHEFVTDELIKKVIERFETITEQARLKNLRAPGTAEFLDAIRACDELRVVEGSPEWAAITGAAMCKHTKHGEALA